MEFLGVGPLELLFIFLIALIVLGPKDMAKTGRTLGRFMYRVVTSPTWQSFRQASRDLRQLPTKLMREAGLEDQELKKLSEEIGFKDVNLPVSRQDLSLSSWTTPTTAAGDSSALPNPIESSEDQNPPLQLDDEAENTIAPPGSIQVFDNPGLPTVDEQIPPTSEPPVTAESHSSSPAETHPEMPSEIGSSQETETQ